MAGGGGMALVENPGGGGTEPNPEGGGGIAW